MTDAPLTFYLDIREGEVPNLDVVARAAIEWSSAIREIAHHIDPSAEVSVGLVSGTSGSLKLNSLIRSRENTDGRNDLNIRTAVSTAAIFIAVEIAAWGVGETMDWITGPDAPPSVAELPEDEREALARDVVDQLANRLAREKVERVYKTLDEDDTITGVGVTAIPEKRPESIVPRDQFMRFFGSGGEVEQENKRTQNIEIKLTLVRPFLRNDTERFWRFSSERGDFSAKIKDTDFLEDVMAGTTSIPMMEGLVMDVELEISEIYDGSIWTPKSYTVRRVHALTPPMRQDSWIASEAQHGEAENDN